jgi:hypothetical protein
LEQFLNTLPQYSHVSLRPRSFLWTGPGPTVGVADPDVGVNIVGVFVVAAVVGVDVGTPEPVLLSKELPWSPGIDTGTVPAVLSPCRRHDDAEELVLIPAGLTDDGEEDAAAPAWPQ